MWRIITYSYEAKRFYSELLPKEQALNIARDLSGDPDWQEVLIGIFDLEDEAGRLSCEGVWSFLQKKG